MWRVFQPDCPVVSLSESLGDTLLVALSSTLTESGIHGFLGVERRSVRRVVERLREDLRVAQARVAKLRGDKGVVELFMRNTRMMDFLASKQLVVWFQPLYAVDGHEYWAVAFLGRSAAGLVEALEDEGHDVKVMESATVDDLSVPKLVFNSIRALSALKSAPEPKMLETLLGSSLSKAALELGVSRSAVLRKRRRALETLSKCFSIYQSILR